MGVVLCGALAAGCSSSASGSPLPPDGAIRCDLAAKQLGVVGVVVMQLDGVAPPDASISTAGHGTICGYATTSDGFPSAYIFVPTTGHPVKLLNYPPPDTLSP